MFIVLARTPARQVAPSDELKVVNHPIGAEVILVADETLVKRQIGAHRVLRRMRTERAHWWMCVKEATHSRAVKKNKSE